MTINYPLYKGKINLEFDDRQHRYSVKGKTVYGVTSITGVIAKNGLMYWAANMGAEMFLKNVKAGVALDEVQIKQLADLIKTAHTQKKETAADLGSMIHDWLDQFLKAGIAKKPLPKMPINPEMRNAIKSFLDWTKKNKVKFIQTERKVYSLKYKYAGTCDGIAMVNGKPTIIDFKTGNAVYPEMFLQTVAYQAALQEETGKKFTHNLVLRLSKEDKTKGVKPFEVIETINHAENFKTFLAAKQIYEWQMANKKVEIINKVNGK
jgi:hypothetical protein